MIPASRSVSPTVKTAIDAWLARNGGARRFERGTSNDFAEIGRYLARHGYAVQFSQKGEFRITKGRGAAKKIRVPGLFKIVDELRIAEGLPPFDARNRQ